MHGGAPDGRRGGKPDRLREAHAHIAAHGRSMEMLDLSGCRSLAECLDAIARAASDGSRAWVLAHGLRIESWPEARWPSIRELDGATGAKPCVVMSFDHHSACANSAAMRAAKIRAGDRIEPGGVVCVDAAGEATGVLLEGAASRAWNAAPEPDGAARVRHVASSLRALSALGYAHVEDMLSPSWLGPILHQLEREGSLACDVGLYAPVAALAEVAGTRAGWESSRLRLRGGKIFVDGTLNSRTAAMLTDYRDPAPGFPRGQALMGVGDVVNAMRAVYGVLGDGGELAAHAIGDAAVRTVLDAVEAWTSGGGRGVVRVRVEHAEVIDAADVARFAGLGVTASLQPCHLLADIEALARYLPHRLDRVLPIRELIESGLVPGRSLVFGSDVPIVRAEPEDSILAAVERRRADMPSRGAR
jgi:predicted amidohydrolase YtcJ